MTSNYSNYYQLLQSFQLQSSAGKTVYQSQANIVIKTEKFNKIPFNVDL